MRKRIVAVIGAKGFVGSQIVRAVRENKRYGLVQVSRDDPVEEMLAKVDVVVHSANPAKRFQVKNYPVVDFEETVEKTAKLFALAQGKRFVLISSLSCRTQKDTHYGRHRRACELIVLTRDSLVVRLGPMFGGGRKKNMLHDILAGRKVYIAAKTRYAYADVAWVGQKVVELLEGPPGVQEIGARNAVCLDDIRKHFNSGSVFEGVNETQIPVNCPDGPDANDVYAFAEKELKEQS